MIWKLLAMVLLAGDPEGPAPDSLPAPLCQAIQDVALEWEIRDCREIFLDDPANPRGGLYLLRQRRAELHGAPPVHDVLRFPDRDFCRDVITFNRAYRHHLDAAGSTRLHRFQEYADAIRETDRLYECWDLMRDASSAYYYTVHRRQALKQLKTLIGPAAYYAAEMPPWVPVWRFQEAP